MEDKAKDNITGRISQRPFASHSVGGNVNNIEYQL